MGTLGAKAIAKVSGAAWNQLRPAFMKMCGRLLDVSPEATGELTTIYVKFTVGSQPTSPVYAVVWVKNSKSLTVGFSLPEEYQDAALGPSPQGMRYQGLTHYFTISPEEDVPEQISGWALAAYQHVMSQA